MEERRTGDVGRLVYALLEAGGRTHQEIADEVRRQIPEARTTAASVASTAVSFRRQITPGLRSSQSFSRLAPLRRALRPTPFTSLDTRLTALHPLMVNIKREAVAYYELTGRPLGVTGEVGEYEAATRLGLNLALAREPGFDAVDRAGNRYQIKARSWDEQGARRSQQVGGIKMEYAWDAVLLVLLDRNLEATSIWRAERAAIAEALAEPGSRARNERGALSVSKFKAIGGVIWPAEL